MTWREAGLAALLLAGCAGAGWGAEAAAEESPAPEHGKLNTADASPIEPRHFELEFAYSYTHATRAYDNSRGSRRRGSAFEHAPRATLTIGAVRNLDVNIGWGYNHVYDAEYDHDAEDAEDGPHHGHHIGDTGVGMRYRFLRSDALSYEVAYLGGLTVPTGCECTHRHLGTSQEFWSWDQGLVVSKDWGKWTANAELGYALPFGGKRGEARGTLTANLAAGYQALKWLQPEAELNYHCDFARNGSGADSLAVTAGLVLPLDCIRAGTRISVGAQRALTGRNSDQFTTLLLAVKLAW